MFWLQNVSWFIITRSLIAWRWRHCHQRTSTPSWLALQQKTWLWWSLPGLPVDQVGQVLSERGVGVYVRHDHSALRIFWNNVKFNVNVMNVSKGKENQHYMHRKFSPNIFTVLPTSPRLPYLQSAINSAPEPFDLTSSSSSLEVILVGHGPITSPR